MCYMILVTPSSSACKHSITSACVLGYENSMHGNLAEVDGTESM